MSALTPPSLQDLWNRPNELGLDDRRRIVEQALLMLESVYVHRPQKEAMHAVIPLQRLRLLRAELDAQTNLAIEALLPDLAFHRQMVDIFAAFRDLHTAYLLPQPYSRLLAYLPFMAEACVEGGREQVLVTRLVQAVEPTDFVPGVEITHWNGIPIRRAIELNGEHSGGGNRDAAFARGLHALTMRPLARTLPPDEDWVTVSYRNVRGLMREARFTWSLFDLTQAAPASNERSGVARYRYQSALGVDVHAALIRSARRSFFSGRKLRRSAKGAAPRSALAHQGEELRPLQTGLPTVFRAYPIAGGRYGYLRIFSFDVTSADGFVDECRSLLAQLPPEGLVIDIRGNPGGNILAAEGVLQLFTPRRVQPAPFQFINTALTLQLCERFADSTQAGLALGAWVESIRESVRTGATHSVGASITPEREANAIGQQYYGRLVLVTDPLSYSAADIFAASFQDHALGPVIGVSGRTGAGGANVWQHALLEVLLRGTPGSLLEPLPLDTAMTVAIRRSLRVGKHAGALLEDFGVVPDATYWMTARDVLGNNTDLIGAATALLDQLAVTHPARTLRLRDLVWRDHVLAFTLTTAHLTRVDLWVDNRPWQSLTVTDGMTQVSAILDRPTPRWLRAQGFAASNALEPVARAAARI